MAAKPIYRVVFLNQGKVYEVYARHVSQTGSLFGFVEIEELVFDARKGVASGKRRDLILKRCELFDIGEWQQVTTRSECLADFDEGWSERN